MENKILFNGISEEVTTRLLLPKNPLCLYVFGHGAGAGIDHDFIKTFQDVLFKKNIASFTFNFVYKERGKRLPSSKKAVDNEYKAVWKYITESYADQYPLFAGGKSMGGRVSTRIADDLIDVKGLIFLGFPIHTPGKPDKIVGEYIQDIKIPMLFLQGSKDPMSTIDVAEKLMPKLFNAKLYWLEGGKHSWETNKSAKKNQSQLMDEASDQIVTFCTSIINKGN